MDNKKEKPDILYGFLIFLLLAVTMFNICIFSYVGCEMVPWLMAGGFDQVEQQQTAQAVQSTPTPATPAPTPTPEGQSQPDGDASLSIELIAGQAGDYGREIVYNQGTELEEKRYGYYVPTGQYNVTNVGEYPSQINVYSDETTITDAGWEEVAETFSIELLDVGESASIEVGNNQHIEIAEPSAFKLETITAQNTIAPPETTKAPDPTQAPAATKQPDPTKAPETTKAPEATKQPSSVASTEGTILPINPTTQPNTQGSSTGTAQQGSAGGDQQLYPKDSSKGTYVGSTEKKIYHYPTCYHAKKILPEHEIWFDTVAGAIANGRRACEVCHPPIS